MMNKTVFLMTLGIFALGSVSLQAEDQTAVLSKDDQKIKLDWFKKPVARVKGKLSFIGMTGGTKKRDSRVDQGSFITKGDFGVTLSADAQDGSSYGGVISLDLRREKAGSQDFIKAAYAYYNSLDYGTLQIGEMEGALDQALMDGRDIMGATGGFDGNFFTFTTASAGVMSGYKQSTYDKYATKLLYKTPVFNGFQFVMSFSPSSQLLGARSRGPGGAFDAAMDKNKAIQLKRTLEGVLSYGFDLSGVDINLFLGGGVANPILTTEQKNNGGATVNSAKVFQTGMIIDFGDFQMGGGYLHNGKSLTRKDVAGNYGDAYNAAMGYKIGRHYVAAGHMGSSRKVEGGHAKATITSVTYEYSAAPGLTVFGEMNYFDTRNTSQYYANNNVTNNINTQLNNKRLHASTLGKNNKGSVFLVGTAIRF